MSSQVSEQEPEPEPETYVFRHVAEQCLRHFAASVLEDGTLKQHKAVHGEDFIPADECSELDGGLIDRLLLRLIGLEVKTLVIAYRLDAHINTKSGPLWIGTCECTSGQLQSDVISIAFPTLRRNQSWRVVLNPAANSFHEYWLRSPGRKKIKLRFQQSAAGQKLENVIPPPLWPSVLDARTAPLVLSALRDDYRDQAGVLSSSNDSHSQSPTLNTSADQVLSRIVNDAMNCQKRMVEYLRQCLAALPECPFEIIETTFNPYNADFAIKHITHGSILVELKCEHCWIQEDDTGDNSKVRIKHLFAHPDQQRPIFTYAGARWSHLVSSYGREMMDVPGIGKIPRYAVFGHRLDFPTQFWYGTPNPDGSLEGRIDKSCLLDLSEGLGPRLVALLEKAIALGRFKAPPLESFDSLSPAQIKYHQLCYSKAADRAANFTPRIQRMDLKSHRPHYLYQAQASLSWFHSCRDARQGLLYDWQFHHQLLRAYAFTFYNWSPEDLAFVSVRPRRTPVEIFEQACSKFIFLSFCDLRQHAQENAIYIPSFASEGLLEACHEQFFSDSHILIIKARNTLAPDSSHAPVYAIPLAAITKGPSVASNRWHSIKLGENENMEDYLFDDRVALIHHLHSSFLVNQSFVEIGKHKLPFVDRGEVYAAITEGYRSSQEEQEEEEEEEEEKEEQEAGFETTVESSREDYLFMG